MSELADFLTVNVEPGSTVRTDGWAAYVDACAQAGMVHEPVNVKRSGSKAHQLLPGIHLLFSLLKRWLAGTYQSAFDVAHPPAHLEGFVFRFDRRTSRQRGLVFFRLLEAAVAGPPVTYRDLVANRVTTNAQVNPPGVQAWPRSLAQPPAFRPWRTPRPRPHRLAAPAQAMCVAASVGGTCWASGSKPAGEVAGAPGASIVRSGDTTHPKGGPVPPTLGTMKTAVKVTHATIELDDLRSRVRAFEREHPGTDASNYPDVFRDEHGVLVEDDKFDEIATLYDLLAAAERGA